MRRRKMHGLAGSPEHHFKRIRNIARSSAESFDAALEAAEKGHCDTAIARYSHASILRGSAGTHIVFFFNDTAPTEKDLHDYSSLHSKDLAVKSALKQACLRPGSLSGMRKRRR